MQKTAHYLDKQYVIDYTAAGQNEDSLKTAKNWSFLLKKQV